MNPKSAYTEAKIMADRLLRQGKAYIWISPASVATSKNCTPVNQKLARLQKMNVSLNIQKVLAEVSFNGKQCRFIVSFSATDADPSPGDKYCTHYSNYDDWTNSIRPQLVQALRNAKVGRTSSHPVLSLDSGTGLGTVTH